MASRIKGVPVVLYEKTKTGTDVLSHPVYEETPVTVENVLISPAKSEDIPTTLDLSGHKVEYTLGIPKGDTHTWTGCRVDFFGQSWKVAAPPVEGIEELIPLDWNRKVLVERYG